MTEKTRQLHESGQRIWLDSISRELLQSGTLARYINDYSVTGLTSNPTIFEQAIRSGGLYDSSIAELSAVGKTGEDLFFDLALQDLRAAAELFAPIHQTSAGADGWVSLEVSPLLADHTDQTSAAAANLHQRAARPNLFIKIPGTAAGIPAIAQSIFAGIPINVTLLFSCEQYQAAAEAYLSGIERRVAAGLSAQVESVASIFVSRWDAAANLALPAAFHNRLGIAVAQQCYRAHCEILASARWQKLAASGARPQRLLWASTGAKDPALADTIYVDSLAAVGTITTLPEKTLLAFADHGQPGAGLRADGDDADAVIADLASRGIAVGALAEKLQREGVTAFVKSWTGLLAQISAKVGPSSKAT
jgi:transaldolase